MVDGQDYPREVFQPIGSEGAAPDTNQTAPDAARLVRRRLLLKGIAAGVPAIVTLQSGAALAATSITPQCITPNGPSFAGQPRCLTATAAGTSVWVYKIDNDTVWGGGTPDGPCAGGQYGAVYVDNDGAINTSSPNYGATNTTTNTQPVAGYYAITKSCWSSFYWP
ncbi:MAG: hypothetical protein HW380_1748 [Magnetococcales bacterium]|nr:hypothetical protein [Magnetococcales bacterium]HIJ84463.1 hypothetical protein [Magnetococcales bacterium]